MPLRLAALAFFALSPALRASAAAPEYALRYDAEAETMSVRLCLVDAAAAVRFDADDQAPRYVGPIARTSGRTIARTGEGWIADGWAAHECLAYTADIGRIADAGRRASGARRGNDLVTDPSLWLLRVDGADDAEARVELPDGVSISAPWHAIASHGGARRYRIPATPEDWMARVAIGHFAEAPMALPGGTLRVAILEGADAAERTRLTEWIGDVARAAVSAYGRLPLEDVQVLVVPVGRAREPVVFGQSTRGEGHGLTLFVDPSRPVAEFDRDWVAVHELSHLFHPYLGDRGAWLAEGLATYYQNVLRARAGLLTEAQAWEQLDAGFARGRSNMPPADAGTLEEASASMGARHDFMRVYWSGTAYWLGVDAELRRKSGNQLGVDEAILRFDACCLPSKRRWTPEAFVAKLDALLGTDVFARRYASYRARTDFPDLSALYAELGIRRQGDRLGFDDEAPAADVRRSIMTARPAAAKAAGAR